MRLTIGLNSDDVMTLCTSPKINKWSARKPTDDGTALTDTPAELSDTAYAQANYGLIVPALVGSPASCSTLWAYRGRRWGRLTDFVGYNHGSKTPFTGDGNVEIYIDETSRVFTGNGSTPPPAPGVSTLDWASMASMKDMYFCVGLKAPTENIWIKTAASKIGSVRSLTWNKSELPVTTAGSVYTYYICACDRAVTTPVNLNGTLPSGMGTPSFRSLPSDIVLTGTFTLKDAYAFDFGLSGVGASASVNASGDMIDVKSFAPSSSDTQSTLTSSSGNIAIAVTLTGTGKNGAVLTKSTIAAKLINGLSMTGPSATTNYIYPTQLYSATLTDSTPSVGGGFMPIRYTATAVDSITVNPGQTVKAIIYFGNSILFSNNAGNGILKPTTKVTKSSIIQFFFYHNVWHQKGSVPVRVTNGS